MRLRAPPNPTMPPRLCPGHLPCPLRLRRAVLVPRTCSRRHRSGRALRRERRVRGQMNIQNKMAAVAAARPGPAAQESQRTHRACWTTWPLCRPASQTRSPSRTSCRCDPACADPAAASVHVHRLLVAAGIIQLQMSGQPSCISGFTHDSEACNDAIVW